jgi:hypothetical protein
MINWTWKADIPGNVIAADTGRRSVDRDHRDDDDEDDDSGGRVDDNEVDAVDDKGVSHVFLPTTRRTIVLFLSLTYLNVHSHREEVPIDG